MHGYCLAWILLSVIFSAAPLQAQSWYNSSCFCRCQNGTADAVQCHISKIATNGFECADVDPNSAKLRVTCDKFSPCEAVAFEDIFRFFPVLQDLSIDACSLNFRPYEIVTQTAGHNTSNISTVNWNVTFDRQPGTWSSFAFFFKLDAQWVFMNKTILPPCLLTNLVIENTIIYTFPKGLVVMCHRLEMLTLQRNDLTILDIFDLASILSRPNLWLLNLKENSLLFLAPEFISLAMIEVHNVLYNHLSPWLEKFNSSLNKDNRKKLNELADVFDGWTNNLTPLYFEDLVSYIKYIDIDFIYEDSPLSHLYLSKNLLASIPVSLIGFNNLTFLHINHNVLRYSFDRIERFIFFPLQNSLRNLSLHHNHIDGLPEDSFEFLANVTKMNLRRNKINFLSPKAFKNNSHIQYLVLSHNSLTVFDFHDENVLPNLIYLDISHNQIYSLTPYLSNVMPNINKFFLRSNKMTTIAPFSLRNLTNLYSLDVGSMTDLPSKYLRTNPRKTKNLRVVVILKNNRATPVNCDCFSVFPELARELNRTSDFHYPYVRWSNDTRCRQFIKEKGRFHLENHTFFCNFRDEYPIDSTKGHKKGIRLICPWMCSCAFLHPENIMLRINCSSRSLTYIPPVPWSESLNNASRTVAVPISHLWLNNNKIRSISMNEFSTTLASLRSLNLASNSLEMLGARIFQHLSNLRSLDISFNNIYFIDINAFAASRSIRSLILEDLNLHSLPSAPFQVLQKLEYLRLSMDRTFECHCKDMLAFRAFRKGRSIHLSGNCSVPGGDGRVFPVDATERVCLELERENSERLRTALFYAGLGISSCGVFALSLSFLFAANWRLRLRVYLDASVRSALARRCLLLRAPNLQRQIDAAIFAHERQTGEVRVLLQRLAKSSRRALITVRLAARLPGATPLSHLAEIARNSAAFVLFLSKDLLDDERTREALRKFLTECQGPRIVPILFDRSVLEHDLWPFLSPLLRRWPLLAWHEASFWMRFLPSLPAPKSSAGEVVRLPPILSRARPRNWAIADLCVVAIEAEKEAAGRLVDRYRGSSTLCFLCRDRMFGATVGEHRGRNLREVLALCSQILVLVSPDFLRDPWSQRRLVPALIGRLEAMSFRGSVILIEMSLSVPSMCRSRRFRFYDDLRRQTAAVSLAWPAIEANWCLLNQLLITKPASMTSEDIEFDHMLRMPAIQLEEDGSRLI